MDCIKAISCFCSAVVFFVGCRTDKLFVPIQAQIQSNNGWQTYDSFRTKTNQPIRQAVVAGQVWDVTMSDKQPLDFANIFVQNNGTERQFFTDTIKYNGSFNFKLDIGPYALKVLRFPYRVTSIPLYLQSSDSIYINVYLSMDTINN